MNPHQNHDRHYYTGQNIVAVRVSAADERDLFRRLKEEGYSPRLVEEAVLAYISFALYKARQDMGRRTVEARMKCGLAEDDAVSAANLGLMRAIHKFDYTRGARFTTYAGWWIKKALSEARYEAHAIKVPSSDRKKFSQFAKMKREGLNAEEIAEILNLAVAEVERILDLPSGRQDSFDSPIPLEFAPEVVDTEQAERGEREELLAKLEEAKMKLGKEELGLLHDRFSRNMTNLEISRSRNMPVNTVKEKIKTILHVLKITLSD